MIDIQSFTVVTDTGNAMTNTSTKILLLVCAGPVIKLTDFFTDGCPKETGKLLKLTLVLIIWAKHALPVSGTMVRHALPTCQ
jgi:hypothetical protein